MFHDPTEQQEKLGTLLGMAPGNVPVYSCNYDQYDPAEYSDRHSFRHYVDGIYMGYKWQCVELARRWLYLNTGCVFADVAMAYDIFRLRSLRHVASNKVLPLYAFTNGGPRPPEVGGLLVWDEGGMFEETGHVAIITAVEPDRVCVVEQNVYNHCWPAGQSYSRCLPLGRDENGHYRIQAESASETLLGWVLQTEDARGSVDFSEPNVSSIRFTVRETQHHTASQWLSESEADEKAYIRLNGQRLAGDGYFQHRYLSLGSEVWREIKRASNEIHAMFMHATDHVLQDSALQERFNIPEIVWPRIHKSWANRNNETIAGRLDLAVSEHGIKVYEYNADSASCLMECGKVQGLWSQAKGVQEGIDAGRDIFSQLVHAWRKNAITGYLHILLDDDPEENYHAQYMRRAAEAAGIRCKVLQGVSLLRWNASGSIVDGDGDPVHTVWKTWAWETALDQIRLQLRENEDQSLQQLTAHNRPSPRLADVLFHPDVMVHEPLWTLIPSNKAILPIVYDLFPDSPYLLPSEFELTTALENSGYVEKPIVGRCGENIVLVDPNEGVLEATTGKFAKQHRIYQALFPLPMLNEFYVQTNAFVIDGKYAGACLRVDRSPIISLNSELPALRIV